MDKIIAIADCNNFYVSCERLFNPKIGSIPTVVLTNNDGSVISRSQEAKQIGIKKGENFFSIKNLVRKKGIEYFSSNYTLYADISERVFSVIKEYVPTVEVYSIDEVFFDLSHLGFTQVEPFLRKLKNEVFHRTGIPISIGAASTKTLAKLANKIAKDGDGVYHITDRKEFLNSHNNFFDLEDIWGIGERSKEKIINLGCKDIMDFIDFSPSVIKKILTITGLRTQMELRGIRCFEVESGFKKRKNISTSRTFGYSINDLDHLQKATHLYVQKAVIKLKKERMLAQSFILSVCNDRHKDEFYYADSFKFKLIRATQDESEIWAQVQSILLLNFKPDIKYRKSSIRLTELIPDGKHQTLLFENLTLPVSYQEPSSDRWKMRRDYLSKKFTSDWNDIPIISKIEDF